jgi:hypothetical protein
MTERSTQEAASDDGYEHWLRRHFPRYVSSELGEHHHEFWRWVESIGLDGALEDGMGDGAARPYVAIWPREHGKSVSAEMATATVGAQGRRRFGLYISGTQKQANDHVAAISGMFEQGFGAAYASVTERRLGKYGQSRGWTQSRLRTPAFAVDAIGLDTGVRGLRDLESRPDWIVLDDIDSHEDSPLITGRKLETITRAILPSGSSDCAVLAIQNLVHPEGVFARLAAPAPEFLTDRILSGPIPAVRDLVLDGSRIIGGVPTWPQRKGLAECQRDIDRWGLNAWLQEAQHDVGLRLREGQVYGLDPEDGMSIYDPRRNARSFGEDWAACKWRIVGIDPGGDGDPTVLVPLGITADDRHHVYGAVVLRGGGLMEWHSALAAIEAEGRITHVEVGETGGTTLASSLHGMGWPARQAVMARSQIPYVQELFKSGRLTIEPGDTARGFESEIATYWWAKQVLEAGRKVTPYATETGTGHHADRLDALRYAVLARVHRGTGQAKKAVGTGWTEHRSYQRDMRR